MMRTIFYLSIFLLVLCPQNSRAGDPLNVILLLSDDHNYRALGCSGNEVIRTPNLDRLASEGVYFNRCFTPNPICTPSRACVYTSQDSWSSGVTFNGKTIPDDAPTLPKLLSAGGYETSFIGKWHNDGKPWTRGYTSGGRCWAGGKFDQFAMALTPFGGEAEDREISKVYSTTAFSDDAVKYLNKNHPKPFCLVVAYTVAHDAFRAPPGYEGKYDPATIQLPPNFMAKPPFKQFNPAIRDETVLPLPRTESDIRKTLAEYYAMIEHMDFHIGRILETLNQKGLAENTLVIFSSVKGMSMGSHGIIGKQTMYEEGLRTSLIVRHPNLKRFSKINSALVSTMDILPTICDAGQLEIPKEVEGESLLGQYEGRRGGRDRLFFSYHDPNRETVTRAMRMKNHKLIHHLLTDEKQFFDLSIDPYELNNLTGTPELEAIESTMMSDLLKWRGSHEDQ